MTGTTVVRPADPTLRAALRLAAAFAFFKLLLQFALTLYTRHIGYGYFRDEFYYILCGRNLAWGYVDHGPLVAVQARLGELLFGDSLFSIRILSAVAGAVAVFLTGVLTWAFGGRRPAQSLAMLALLVAPIYIAMDGFLSMNSCEPMFWAACILSLVLILRGRSPLLCWIAFGLSAGLGLLNKPSLTFFLVALGLGLLLTPQRRFLFTRHAALGIALLLLIASPNLAWQVHNHWPTLEFLRNIGRLHQDTHLPLPGFLLAQLLMMHPVNALLWLTGIVALLRARSLPNLRWLGFAALFFFAVMFTMHAKDYYLAPIYPSLLAAGAIAWERRFAASRAVARDSLFAFPIFETALLLTGAIILPMASPVLRPQPWIAYTQALHLARPVSENDGSAELPQFFADRFAWQEMADQVVATFRTLSPADQAEVCIVGDNYGEAGAIDFLARRAEPRLPPAISHHNNYWIWGRRGCTGRLLIDIADASDADLRDYYNNVQIVGTLHVRYSMPEEHKNIYLLRGRKPTHPVTWEKHFD